MSKQQTDDSDSNSKHDAERVRFRSAKGPFLLVNLDECVEYRSDEQPGREIERLYYWSQPGAEDTHVWALDNPNDPDDRRRLINDYEAAQWVRRNPRAGVPYDLLREYFPDATLSSLATSLGRSDFAAYTPNEPLLRQLSQLESEVSPHESDESTPDAAGGVVHIEPLDVEKNTRDLILMDAKGVVGRATWCNVEWAALSVLKESKGRPMEIQEFAKQLDLVLAECAAEGRRSRPRAEELDGDERYSRTQILTRSSGRRPSTYSSCEVLVIINRIQAALRKVSGERAEKWRKRWLHWDRKSETVTFEYRS